jgi:hypothetical protein
VASASHILMLLGSVETRYFRFRYGRISCGRVLRAEQADCCCLVRNIQQTVPRCVGKAPVRHTSGQKRISIVQHDERIDYSLGPRREIMRESRCERQRKFTEKRGILYWQEHDNNCAYRKGFVRHKETQDCMLHVAPMTREERRHAPHYHNGYINIKGLPTPRLES